MNRTGGGTWMEDVAGEQIPVPEMRHAICDAEKNAPENAKNRENRVLLLHDVEVNANVNGLD